MATFILRRLSTNYGEPRPAPRPPPTPKKLKRNTMPSYGPGSIKDLIRVDLTTGRPIGEAPRRPPPPPGPQYSWATTSISTNSDTALSKQWSAGSSTYSSSSSHRASWCPPSPHSSSSSVYSKRHSSVISASSAASSETNLLKALLRQPEMNKLLRGRTNFTRTLYVQGVRVTLADERVPEIIGRVPYLRTIWTFGMLDLYKYDVDDEILRAAMGAAPIAVCNHLHARAPDGYGDPPLAGGWPKRQKDEECVPDDGFRLSVQCRSCDAMYSVEVVSTHSTKWDGTFEPYLQVQTWRPI